MPITSGSIHIQAQIVVGYGEGGLATLDPASGSVVARAKLSAHPEGFQLDPAAHRAFVNVPDAHEIAVIDLAAGRQSGELACAGSPRQFSHGAGCE